MTTPDPRAWAQTAVRAYASATNMLVPGRRFAVLAPGAGPAHPRALVDLLERFGARVVDDPSSAHAVFEAPPARPGPPAAPGDGPRAPGDPVGGPRLVVRAPIGGRASVTWDGEPLLGPHEAGRGADYGASRTAWARDRMPVTRRAVQDAAPLIAGRTVGLSLVLEPKTAALALMLHEAGARVRVFGHAAETRDDVAEALRAAGIAVFAESGATGEREEELARLFLAGGVEFLLDDGSHLIRMAHDPRRAPGALESLVGAAEETTSGLRALRAFPLRVPVVASNDARSKTLFDNAYATGQSCLLTILDLIDPAARGVALWEQRVAVVGYGDVGKGFARFAAACGAAVDVVETDPVRALQAQMDGHRVAALEEAAAASAVLVSATGEPATITPAALAALPAGAVVAVAGGVEGEAGLAETGAGSWPLTESGSRAVQLLHRPGAAPVRVLDRGACINCTAGEGNPIEVMDMSFGVQVAALRELASHGSSMPPGLRALPGPADILVARRALEALA